MAIIIDAQPTTIIFADSSDTVVPDAIRGTQTLITCRNRTMPYVIIQHQVHCNAGLAVTSENYQSYRTLLTHDSDYLVTNLAQVGLGVLTADCLPIALVDPVQQAIGIVHAGWRGSVGNIVGNAIEHMHTLYGSKPADVHAWLGPCAYPCCYNVDDAFIKQLPDWALPAVTKDLQFDLLACNTIALRACHVPEQNIDRSASCCTICNHQYLSYRRNPSLTARQPSIIWIN